MPIDAKPMETPDRQDPWEAHLAELAGIAPGIAFGNIAKYLELIAKIEVIAGGLTLSPGESVVLPPVPLRLAHGRYHLEGKLTRDA